MATPSAWYETPAAIAMIRTDSTAMVPAGPPATSGRLIMAVPLLLALTGVVEAQEGRTARAAITPELSLVAAKRLEGAREFVAREQWTDALDALAGLSGNFGDSLIEVEPGRFLNVADVCLATIARMPPAGLTEYRSRVDGAAAFLFTEALEQDRPDVMRQLLRTHYASSVGDDALWWLAEDAWARGDLDQARLYWTQLVPLPPSPALPLILRYPDTNIPQASILARLVLCSVMLGDFAAARSELNAFRELYPDEQGRLAGREGVLGEILEDVVIQAGAWPADSAGAECPTFACRPDRNAIATPIRSDLQPLWRTSLTSAGPGRVAGPNPEHSPGTFPVVWNGIVVIQDDAGIRALTLKNGEPAWPSHRPDDRGVIYQSADPGSIEFPSIGISRRSGTVANAHYFARVGPPILVPAAGTLRQFEDRLIALDLGSGEGRLTWEVTADELLGEEGWRFTGSPVAFNEQLYVTVRRASEQVEVAVACVDAGSGNLVWRQPVAIDFESPSQQRHRLDHELLTFANGTVFFANQAGLLVAFEADSGRLVWVASYPSYPLSAAELSHPAHAGLLPPVFDRGMLFLAPRDASHVMAFDAASGVLRWQTRKPDRINALLGVTQNMLVAAGDRLWRIDAETGRLLAPFGYDDPAGYGSGRGVIAGSSVYWTTREDLFEVDLASGHALRRLPLELLGVAGAGNLVIADNCLLFVEPHQLTVFGAR